MTLLDYTVIIIYLVGIVALGAASRGRQDSAEDYFGAGGGVLGGLLGPVIVGLSIAATFFSGISFVAIPSIAIADGTKVAIMLVSLVPVLIIVPRWFLPRYFACGGRTPYEIVALRLGPRVRAATSILYILLRIGWMASLIYAPTIVLLAMLGLGREWTWPLILVVGLSSTLYTVVAGLRGVIITDALQMLIILGSLMIAAGCALSQMPFEPSNWVQRIADEGKLTAPSWSLSLVERFTVWGVIVGVTISNLSTYMADQMSLQRYLSLGGPAAARRSFFYNMAGVFCVLVLLLGLGFLIVLWRTYHPAAVWPQQSDRVFPAFVAAVLPPGFSGLMAAAILSATMSSITSGINTLAGAVTGDFVKPARPLATPRELLVTGRWLSVFIGLLATVGAGLASSAGTIFDVSQAILGVFAGPIFGVLLCAVIGRPVPQWRSLLGLCAGVVTGVAIVFTSVQTIWITTFGFSAYLLVAAPYGGRTGRRGLTDQ